MKVVINRCGGGFGASENGFERMIELGLSVTFTDRDGEVRKESAFITHWIRDRSHSSTDPRYTFTHEHQYDNELRTHPALIRTVEELGNAVNNRFSKLEIVEVPDDVLWKINQYAGFETVEEKHRSWP